MTACPNCEYHKNRAARWRAEAYKQAGHDLIELPWVGLTNDEVNNFAAGCHLGKSVQGAIYEAEAKLKEKNGV